MVTSWERWRARATPLVGDGSTVATYDLGPRDAPVVTFLHGFPSSSLDIAPAAALLGDDVRVLTLDFPGFGASDKPVEHTYSIHAATDAVERLWAACGITSTVLVAHDYGVSVGQELLARHAGRALAVELTATVWMNGGLYPDLHRPTLGQQLLSDPDHGAAVAASITESAFADAIRATWGTRVALDADAVAGIWASMDERGGIRLMHRLLGYMADRREHAARWTGALETSDLPMTFVWGDVDPVSGAHMIARVEERLPHADVRRLADVGHWPPLEVPAEVASAVRDAIGAG